MLTTDQVLMRLTEEGITENIQVVRRWIRNGELPATAPVKRKDGYLVSEVDLAAFIEQKRKKQKRTTDEYEVEIQQLREALKQSQEENIRLRNELDRSEERYAVLSGDLHDALDKLANNKKDGMVNWKRKYDEALKCGREKTNKLIAAEQEIDILKKKLADSEKYGVQTKSAAADDGPILTLSERFQFQSKKYEAKVYTYRGKYSVYLYEVWGSYKKEVQIDKSTPLFKRFLKIVKEKHGMSIEMALASWQQLVSAKEADL